MDALTVLAALDKAAHAHRTAHHTSVRAAREHRERLRAQAENRAPAPESVEEPLAEGLISGDTISGSGDLAGLE